jgi:hypothetical protein
MSARKKEPGMNAPAPHETPDAVHSTPSASVTPLVTDVDDDTPAEVAGLGGGRILPYPVIPTDPSHPSPCVVCGATAEGKLGVVPCFDSYRGALCGKCFDYFRHPGYDVAAWLADEAHNHRVRADFCDRLRANPPEVAPEPMWDLAEKAAKETRRLYASEAPEEHERAFDVCDAFNGLMDRFDRGEDVGGAALLLTDTPGEPS